MPHPSLEAVCISPWQQPLSLHFRDQILLLWVQDEDLTQALENRGVITEATLGQWLALVCGRREVLPPALSALTSWSGLCSCSKYPVLPLPPRSLSPRNYPSCPKPDWGHGLYQWFCSEGILASLLSVRI